MSGNCKLNTMIGIASLMHFLVDGLCICALYLMVNNFCIAEAFAVFMTYNVLAFMTQPFTGIWVDKLRNKHLVLLVSCISLALASDWLSVLYSVHGLCSISSSFPFVCSDTYSSKWSWI